VRKYVRIGVSALLLAFIAWRADWSDIFRQFERLRIEFWFAAVGLYMIATIASARRWQLYAQKMGFEHTLPQFCAYTFIGMFFSLALPTVVGGDIMRVWYLNGQSGRKWSAITSVFLERINGLVILIGTACVGLLVAPVDLPSWMVTSVWVTAGCVCAGLAMTPILRSWRRLSEERREQLARFLDVLRTPRTMIETSGMSVLVQGAAVLLVWCLGIGLGLEVPIACYCVLVPMVTLMMHLPISLNGMGVREGGTVLFLLPFGVEPSAALTLAFLWFTTGVAVSLMGGVVYLSAGKWAECAENSDCAGSRTHDAARALNEESPVQTV
jgi:uncharacterized protein (TIRG00374 family)